MQKVAQLGTDILFAAASQCWNIKSCLEVWTEDLATVC